MYMALSDFDGWSNVIFMIIFAVLGGVSLYMARPSAKRPPSWTKAYKVFGILFLVLTGVNFLLAVMHLGKAIYTENVPATMDAVIPMADKNGNVFYNSQNEFPPTRANAVLAEAAPGQTRANALRRQAKIPNTPV